MVVEAFEVTREKFAVIQALPELAILVGFTFATLTEQTMVLANNLIEAVTHGKETRSAPSVVREPA